jgi:predicted membrane protein
VGDLKQRDLSRNPLVARFKIDGVRGGQITGITLVLLGALLFIDNLDVLPFRVAPLFWPLLIVVFCAWMLSRISSAVGRVWLYTGIFWGAVMLLNQAGLIRISGDIFWPLVLIAAGYMLLRHQIACGKTEWSDWKHWCDRCSIGSSAKSVSLAPHLEDYAVFSHIKRRIESLSFDGAELTSVFGNIEVDLRNSSILMPERQAVIEANAAFGAIELRIPESWRVSLQGHAVFGSYEDKTIPPRPDPGSPTATLVITGGTAFGAVVIKN